MAAVGALMDFAEAVRGRLYTPCVHDHDLGWQNISPDPNARMCSPQPAPPARNSSGAGGAPVRTPGPGARHARPRHRRGGTRAAQSRKPAVAPSQPGRGRGGLHGCGHRGRRGGRARVEGYERAAHHLTQSRSSSSSTSSLRRGDRARRASEGLLANAARCWRRAVGWSSPREPYMLHARFHGPPNTFGDSATTSPCSDRRRCWSSAGAPGSRSTRGAG